MAERRLTAEMDVHLEAERERESGNHRNGHGRKTVLTPDGEMTLSIPRDRHGRFDPALIAKYQRRFRQDHRALRTGHEHSRHAGPYPEAVRPGDFSRPDLGGHRLGPGGGGDLPESPAGIDLRLRILRRATGQDPRRRHRAQ